MAAEKENLTTIFSVLDTKFYDKNHKDYFRCPVDCYFYSYLIILMGGMRLKIKIIEWMKKNDWKKEWKRNFLVLFFFSFAHSNSILLIFILIILEQPEAVLNFLLLDKEKNAKRLSSFIDSPHMRLFIAQFLSIKTVKYDQYILVWKKKEIIMTTRKMRNKEMRNKNEKLRFEKLRYSIIASLIPFFFNTFLGRIDASII